MGAGARKICWGYNVLQVQVDLWRYKPGDGLSSGSWLKIKRSKSLSHVRLSPTGAHFDGSRCPHPFTCKGFDSISVKWG